MFVFDAKSSFYFVTQFARTESESLHFPFLSDNQPHVTPPIFNEFFLKFSQIKTFRVCFVAAALAGSDRRVKLAASASAGSFPQWPTFSPPLPGITVVGLCVLA